MRPPLYRAFIVVWWMMIETDASGTKYIKWTAPSGVVGLTVKSIVMWYALYESVFFKIIDPYRENNIHCVKLDQTALSQKYKRSLEYLVGSWSKYTALNILPLRKYGTIEFRHLQGTGDTVLVKEWLDTLENLWLWGQENTLHKNLLTPEWLAKSFHAIFKDSPRALALEPQLEQLISNSLIDIKLSLI